MGQKLRPVMVYIHGGLLAYGSSGEGQVNWLNGRPSGALASGKCKVEGGRWKKLFSLKPTGVELAGPANDHQQKIMLTLVSITHARFILSI